MKQVEVLPYDSNWPLQYEAEAKKIRAALGDDLVEIYHVGSTSVPGLAAKRKIDIIVEVRELNFEHSPLIEMSYEYRGGFNLPFRKSFTMRSENVDVNLHIFEKGDPEVELNLLFRDYLRNHPDAKEEYAALKYQLIEEESSHQIKKGDLYRGYTLGKHNLIQAILKKCHFDRFRLVICTHHTEWEKAREYRQKYFFDKQPIEDPYTWTFDHEDHQHFVCYQGCEIVGYAHIQLWPKKRSAIRIIVIDEEKRQQAFGRKFLQLLEKYLKMKGYQTIHAESSPEALGFYKKLSYIEMPFNDPDGYEEGEEDIAVGKVLIE